MVRCRAAVRRCKVPRCNGALSCRVRSGDRVRAQGPAAGSGCSRGLFAILQKGGSGATSVAPAHPRTLLIRFIEVASSSFCEVHPDLWRCPLHNSHVVGRRPQAPAVRAMTGGAFWLPAQHPRDPSETRLPLQSSVARASPRVADRLHRSTCAVLLLPGASAAPPATPSRFANSRPSAPACTAQILQQSGERSCLRHAGSDRKNRCLPIRDRVR